MALECGSYIRTCQIALNVDTRNIQGIESEDVVVNDRVVPWRSGTIVAIVLSFHPGIPSKPLREIVDAVTKAFRSTRSLLPTRGDAIAVFSGRDFPDGCRNVQ